MREYLAVLLERKEELQEDGLLKPLDNAISNFKTRELQKQILAAYVGKHQDKSLEEWPPLPRIQYPKQVDTYNSFTLLEDNYLLKMTQEVGFGNWLDLNAKLLYNFDLGVSEKHLNLSYFLASRTPTMLAQRVQYLLRSLGAFKVQDKTAPMSDEEHKSHSVVVPSDEEKPPVASKAKKSAFRGGPKTKKARSTKKTT